MSHILSRTFSLAVARLLLIMRRDYINICDKHFTFVMINKLKKKMKTAFKIIYSIITNIQFVHKIIASCYLDNYV